MTEEGAKDPKLSKSPWEDYKTPQVDLLGLEGTEKSNLLSPLASELIAKKCLVCSCSGGCSDGGECCGGKGL